MQTTCVAMPGAFNGLVARAVADAGFDACYVSGGAISAASGVPDIGLLSLEAFSRVIREVADSSGLPVIADADTGFGEGEMLTRTVWEYHRAGAAGFHIEDQVFPKRCGHLDGKALVSVDNMQEKISRAASARDACSGGSFIVCARTDARSVEGIDQAIERSMAYLDAGADMLFPEGFHSEEELGRFAEAVRGRGRNGGPFLLGNMTEFGKTPIIPMDRWESLGYSCVIFPVTSLRVAMGAVTKFLEALRRDGHVEASLDTMQPRKELYELLGYTPGTEWVYPGSTRRD
ncbi:MAG: methylisocitrate lyase [Phycisphaeraceae bacterium]|nr:MAG: methylisocitrate lyase [Phycisphaeraceae bacterium]